MLSVLDQNCVSYLFSFEARATLDAVVPAISDGAWVSWRAPRAPFPLVSLWSFFT